MPPEVLLVGALLGTLLGMLVGALVGSLAGRPVRVLSFWPTWTEIAYGGSAFAVRDSPFKYVSRLTDA